MNAVCHVTSYWSNRAAILRAVGRRREWMRASFSTFGQMLRHRPEVVPVRTKAGLIVWIGKIDSQPQWVGYWWDVESDPGIALAQEMFIAQKGFQL